MKILVVDDEESIADLVEVYLKSENYQVYQCNNGRDALDCVEREEIDLAILDVMLPDIDGFRLCQKIRETHFFPIIMLTARVEDMDKIMGLTLGADDYITKPFNPLGLIRPVAAGETAGYGRAFLAKRPCLLGVVTVGYGDGLMRHYGQQGGQVLLRGTRVPIVGRICMDQMLIDVTEVPDCRPGDIVTLIGRDGQEEITCEEMAEICGTITNEIVSGLGKRLPKCY